jgi:dethiobiotin synthetase
MLPRFFVAGTDTNVGKTQVSVALLEAMCLRGLKPVAFKPFESGMTAVTKPVDSLALQRAGGGWQDLETICLYRFRKPLAPGIASRLERQKTSWKQVQATFRRFDGEPLVVEGAGGLFVPLDARHDVIDAIQEFALPVVLVARAGLGTINHTCLSLEALAARGAKVRAVVLVKSTPAADLSERYNRPELERRFPRTAFLGPVPFEPDAPTRTRIIRKHLTSLLSPRTP